MKAIAPLREDFRFVRVDACAFAAVLIIFGAAFYLYWDFWDDQAAQAYMAWGMFHGMRPYVDLVDPNWPGILLPHVLAYLVAGTNAWGLRALDLVFTYALLVATSLLLAAWGVPLAMRLLAGCAYLTTYFATGWMWTAQRESFGWPLFVIGVMPFLLTVKHPKIGTSAWFWSGVICGLSLWIKPTPVLILIVLAMASARMCDREMRPMVMRGTVWHLLGIAAVSGVFLVGLAAMGELSGFIKWGIYYDLGPYAQVKFPWPTRLHIMFEFFTDLRLRQAALGLALVGIVVVVIYPTARRRWHELARPLITALALVITGALTVLLQGKLGSLYHFIPLSWALTVFAAVIWSIVPCTRSMRDLALLLAAVIVAVTAYKEPRHAGATAGSIAGIKLNTALGPDDEIVEWGYSPSLLLQSQRRTPFMTFIGTAFLTTSPPDSWAYREVLDRLNVALRDPAVRFLLVERLPNYKIQKSTPKWPIDYLNSDDALNATLQAQYEELPDSAIPGFTVFSHRGLVMHPGQ
jgi:hypothetical protein